MALQIHQPHDSFVRSSLPSIEVARDLLQAHLASELVKRIHWDTLQSTNKRFVKEELAQLHSPYMLGTYEDLLEYFRLNIFS